MRLLRVVTALLLTALLGGCLSDGEDEVRQWMAEQRQQIKPKVTPIAPPKPFEPQPYAAESLSDPFGRDKLTQALRKASAQPAYNALVTPELRRRKEALESFPLDAMAMVGSMVRAGRVVALVRVNNQLHQVQTGNYLGQNYGKVVKITETELTLREIAQDPVGEWIERAATLQLQERTK